MVTSTFSAPPTIPVRMINEYVYCPRLAYMMWVQKEWADTAGTVDGRFQHRRVDRKEEGLPEADAASEVIHARSITLDSEKLGIVGKLDLVEADGESATPVDYKRGKRPHIASGAYDPERVQLCAQGFLLEEQGYTCTHGFIYYVRSRERVRIDFDDDLRALTMEAIAGLRKAAEQELMPSPLLDSPKCSGCSLVGICLPDETALLQRQTQEVRPLAVAAEEAFPLHIQEHSAKLSKRGDVLEVSVAGEKKASVRIREVSQVVLQGNVYVTTPCLKELMSREIPVLWHSYGGWFLGHTAGLGHKNVELRTAQYKASFDPDICLSIARGLVDAKIKNCRTQLRRNWKGESKPDSLLRDLEQDARDARNADSLEQLLGHEGVAARRYFEKFGQLIRPAESQLFNFDFNGRNRRPPKDAVNALLSFAYSMLSRSWFVTLSSVGFDAYRGFYHQPRYGRPALALDLMEPFRPILADSVVLQVINNQEIQPGDFVRTGDGVALTPVARKAFLAAFERRMSHEVTHPIFGYKLSYRRLLELQARLLGRYLLGEIDEYPNFVTR